MPGILSLLFILALLSGCIAEDLDDCSNGIPFKVTLPEDASPETIKDMSLYVFDGKDLLIDIRPMNTTEILMLDYPGIPVLHCVALCNTAGGTMLLSPLNKGDSRSNGSISLKPFVPTKAAAKSIFASPDDLFYGELDIENNRTSYHPEEQNLKLFRKSASMIITLRGLQALTGTEDTDYSLIISETRSRMDFKGEYGGPPASYSPPVNLAANRDLASPLFRLFPTANDEGLTIDIYHHNVLLKSVNVDLYGQPVVPVAGKTTNLLLDFNGSVDVQVKVTGWGERTVWVEKVWG